MGKICPSHNAKPWGAKLKPTILISARNGSDMGPPFSARRSAQLMSHVIASIHPAIDLAPAGYGQLAPVPVTPKVLIASTKGMGPGPKMLLPCASRYDRMPGLSPVAPPA